ncbi:MAG: septation protein SpoVG family protein [Candidatus Omnitrophica bacterium]|nr:septation protein SpoVG family protein [Candidatus Omnitrophota bacterium]
MEITEVRIFLKEGQDKKLKAYATLTFDKAFVVRNVKVIEGTKGLFVAMPSRRLKESCPKCNFKNVVRSKYCNQCASALPQAAPKPIAVGENPQKQSEHRDIAHPITSDFREYIQKKVLAAFDEEKKSGPSHPAEMSRASSLPRHDTMDEDDDIEL